MSKKTHLTIKYLESRFTTKQLKVLREGNKRWNIQTGATRSGKTYIDIALRIVLNVIDGKGKSGLNAIFGRSYSSIERNIVIPLREQWGLENISGVKNGNQKAKGTHITIFDEVVYLFGADNKSRAESVRGMSLKYAYCDEVASYPEFLFDLLKSRLDKPYSKCDLTCNPENPNHWFKDFIDKNRHADNTFVQEYSIWDNKYLDKNFIESLCNEYQGTVYYDRYILGKWVAAEGIVYSNFANNIDKHLIDTLETKENGSLVHDYSQIMVGVDFGGNVSKTVFTAVGVQYVNSRFELHILKCNKILKENVDVGMIQSELLDFVEAIEHDYKKSVYEIRADHDIAIINSLHKLFKSKSKVAGVGKVDKSSISLEEYIKIITYLFNTGRLKIDKNCKEAIASFSTLLYDDKKQDAILDNGTCDVDTYDSCRYGMVQFLKNKTYKLIIGV